MLQEKIIEIKSKTVNNFGEEDVMEIKDTVYEVIKILNERDTPIVFILWGGNARSKKKCINLNKHFVVESAHPSPLSCYNGFWGSKPFSKTNEFLKSVNISPINWNLND